jgi:hypothetical protein
MSATSLQRSVNEDAYYTLEEFELGLDFSWVPSLANLTSVAGSFDVVAGSWNNCGTTCQSNSWGTQCNCR